MLLKIIIWAIFGYLVYTWFKDRMALNEGDGKRTIHHHHYHDKDKKKKKNKSDDDDYIDYEEL